MKSLFISLIIFAGMAFGGYALVNKSDDSISQEKFDNKQSLCKEGIETQGLVNNEYQQSNISVASVDIEMYTLSYDFEVAGQTYSAEKQVNKVDADLNPLSQIWYLKKDPSINTTNEPCASFDRIKDRSIDSNNGFYYFLGGAFLGVSGLSGLARTLFSMVLLLFRGNKG